MKSATTISLLVAILGLSLAAEKHQHDDDHHVMYKFEYGVEDHHTGDIKSQHEFRHGKHVAGVYTLKEADGTTRIVKYEAGPHTGFKAEVERIGHPHHHHEHSHAALTQEAGEAGGHEAENSGAGGHEVTEQHGAELSGEALKHTSAPVPHQDFSSFSGFSDFHGFGGHHGLEAASGIGAHQEVGKSESSGNGIEETHAHEFAGHQGSEGSSDGAGAHEALKITHTHGIGDFSSSFGHLFGGHEASGSAGSFSGFGSHGNLKSGYEAYEGLKGSSGFGDHQEAGEVSDLQGHHEDSAEKSGSSYIGTTHFGYKH